MYKQLKSSTFFFFVVTRLLAKPDLNSHESINKTLPPPPLHSYSCFAEEMMHLSGRLLHPGGVGGVQQSLFWNTSSPPVLLQMSWAYLFTVCPKLFTLDTAGVILFPGHCSTPHTFFIESIFRLHSSELFD